MYHTSSPTVYILIFITTVMGDGEKCYMITFELFYYLSSHLFLRSLTQRRGTLLSAVHLVFHPHTNKTQLNINIQTHTGCCIRM